MKSGGVESSPTALGGGVPCSRGGRRLQQGPTVELHRPALVRLPPAGPRHVEQGPDGARLVQVQVCALGEAHVPGAEGSPARDVPAGPGDKDNAQRTTGAGWLRGQGEDLAAVHGTAVVVPSVAVAHRPHVHAPVDDQPAWLLPMARHTPRVRGLIRKTPRALLKIR